MDFLRETWLLFRDNVLNTLEGFQLRDALDILVVGYILYQIIRLIRDTRAMQLLKGIGLILILYFISQVIELNVLGFFIDNILSSGIIVLAVVFQPELRRALEQVGRTKITPLGRYGDPTEELQRKNEQMLEALCAAVTYLSSRKTGALLVIERETKLGEIIKTGTVINAEPSMELIANVFFPNSPLHDGAVIIREGRLFSAGCFLPLSSNMEIGRELGTRHRAALGMSEVSDAVVVIVSEETGAVSVAIDSRLQRKLSPKNLELLLHAKLFGAKTEEEGEKKLPFWRRKNK